jgi:hypothetical protein
MPERRCASHKSLARCSLAARAWPRWIIPRSQRGELHRGKVASRNGRPSNVRSQDNNAALVSRCGANQTPQPCTVELDSAAMRLGARHGAQRRPAAGCPKERVDANSVCCSATLPGAKEPARLRVAVPVVVDVDHHVAALDCDAARCWRAARRTGSPERDLLALPRRQASGMFERPL